MEVYRSKDIGDFDLGVTLPLGEVAVVYDITDHFWFKCYQCGEECEVLEVDGNLDSQSPCLYFLIACPLCKRTGSRKIYMKTAKQMSRESK
jgi:hypothetical protein